jgi:flagellar hook-basal body complex protein FliE
MKKVYVWIVERDWKGYFKPKKVLKTKANKVNIKQHKTKEACEKTISGIWIDDGYQ